MIDNSLFIFIGSFYGRGNVCPVMIDNALCFFIGLYGRGNVRPVLMDNSLFIFIGSFYGRSNVSQPRHDWQCIMFFHRFVWAWQCMSRLDGQFIMSFHRFFSWAWQCMLRQQLWNQVSVGIWNEIVFLGVCNLWHRRINEHNSLSV